MLDKITKEIQRKRREMRKDAEERQKIEDRVNAVVKKAELKQYEEDLLREKMERIKKKKERSTNFSEDFLKQFN